jgi:polar amino acid transport system substrate-binding protein
MDISRRAVGTAAIGTVVATSSLAVAERANAQASTESTFDRVKQSKVLRVAALPGESPYFNKNIATSEWTGMAVEMAKNIVTSFDAKVEYLESTYGNSVLDLQSGKIDLAFQPLYGCAWTQHRLWNGFRHSAFVWSEHAL